MKKWEGAYVTLLGERRPLATCLVCPESDSHLESSLILGSPFAQMALGKMLKSSVLGHLISLYYLVLTIVHSAIGTNCRGVFIGLQSIVWLTVPLLWE